MNGEDYWRSHKTYERRRNDDILECTIQGRSFIHHKIEFIISCFKGDFAIK